MKKQNHLNMSNARGDEQRAVMKKITQDGFCPFCEKHFEKYHPKPILFRTDRWIVTENAWPYFPTTHHFLLVYRKHIAHSQHIDQKGWIELGEIIKRLEEHGLSHGTLLMRFGDMSKTGGTVSHLHIQLVQSDPDNPGYDSEKGLVTRIG